MTKPTSFRLTFIDVVRAFAICMMLQGHFIDGLLADQYRDTSNLAYNIWHFFRGLTAPVFFTVSGFIFMYLLAKESHPQKVGWKHIRVRKGIRRGITLIITMYLLRTNLYNLFSSYQDMNVRMVDVLQCIGLSLLFLIAIYLFSYTKKSWVMPSILLGATLVLFLFEPIYSKMTYDYLPVFVANYFTKANGSVFTIFPWFGYASFGAFMGVLFNINKENQKIYTYAITLSVVLGTLLSFATPFIFELWYKASKSQLAYMLWQKPNLFLRLGNVLYIFTFFMLLRNVITSKTIQAIGQNTFSIYIIHYIILYGTFTGCGLYYFFHNELTPFQAICGAIAFVIVVVCLSFLYNRIKPIVKERLLSYKERLFNQKRHQE